MVAGIVSWGVYLPYWRLERRVIGEAFGTAPGRGRRAVASYDEDTSSMAVEAGRLALAGPDVPSPENLYFSTPAPAYLDKTNAATVHAGLGLSQEAGAYDLCGSVRSGWATVQLAALAGERAPALAVLADLRTGLPGSTDESQGGDGAVAFVFAPDGGVAELLGHAAATDEFLERWRVPGETGSRQWEDRFGEEALAPLARSAFERALDRAGLAAGDVDHLIVSGLHARAVASLRKSFGVPAERVVPDRAELIGNLGAAQGGVGLADVLERATAGQVVAMVEVADGADAVILRTTDALPAVQAARREAGIRTVAEQAERGPIRPALRGLPVVAGDAPARSLPVGPTPSAPTPRPRCGARGGSSASTPVGARCADSAIFPPPGSVCRARRWTRWCRSGWPTSGGRWPPTPSTSWPSACRRRWWGRSSTSTAVAGTGGR